MDSPQDNPANLHTDELQEIVVLCDSDGIILSWNQAGEEITGSARDEVIGYHVDTILAEDSRAALAELMRIERAGSILPGLPGAPADEVRLGGPRGGDLRAARAGRRRAGFPLHLP